MKYAIALLLSLIFVSPALAGDTADLNILGFSADGKIFAFEEYGVQDGSGFPYANRFYIDTSTDKFISGTPIRVRIDDESASVKDARAQAASKGEAIVASGVLAANRGYLAGFNAVTELSADRFSMSVNPRPIFPPIDVPLAVRLEEFAIVPRAGQCDGIDVRRGFRLFRDFGRAASVLTEDTTIPSSRNCPLGYRVGGIQTFYPAGGQPVFAVMVIVRSFGFEGPDHHWIAVMGRLE